MRHTWQSFDVGLDTILATTDATDKISFCLHDANKNVMQKTDASGFLQENYAYAPFGENSGDASADIGFSSEVFEATIALSYYNYRYYAPSFCFWMRRDPIGEYNSNKIYLYVKNNPISNFDTLGLFCDDECSLGSIMMNDVYVKIGLWQNAEYPPDISDGVAGTIPIIMNIGNVLSIPVNPSTIAIDLVINIVDNSAIGSFSPDVEAMQQAIAKIGKEQYRNSGYVVWIYIDYNKCETKKCCPFFDLKHNIWKKQPSWKKVFSKDDSNISSPGGWSQEELTKSLFSRLTKQAVGSFWNDVKRK